MERRLLIFLSLAGIILFVHVGAKDVLNPNTTVTNSGDNHTTTDVYIERNETRIEAYSDPFESTEDGSTDVTDSDQADVTNIDQTDLRDGDQIDVTDTGNSDVGKDGNSDSVDYEQSYTKHNKRGDVIDTSDVAADKQNDFIDNYRYDVRHGEQNFVTDNYRYDDENFGQNDVTDNNIYDRQNDVTDNYQYDVVGAAETDNYDDDNYDVDDNGQDGVTDNLRYNDEDFGQNDVKDKYQYDVGATAEADNYEDGKLYDDRDSNGMGDIRFPEYTVRNKRHVTTEDQTRENELENLGARAVEDGWNTFHRNNQRNWGFRGSSRRTYEDGWNRVHGDVFHNGREWGVGDAAASSGENSHNETDSQDVGSEPGGTGWGDSVTYSRSWSNNDTFLGIAVGRLRHNGTRSNPYAIRFSHRFRRSPNSIRNKRQTTIDVDAQRDPSGHTDVNARGSRTWGNGRNTATVHGNVNRGPTGRGWGVGGSYSRTWNNGRTRLGVRGSHSRFNGRRSNNVGVRFSHRFRRSIDNDEDSQHSSITDPQSEHPIGTLGSRLPPPGITE